MATTARRSLVRRFSLAVRRQDWFQVLVELLVVIIGILIALQVDNWNDQRKAREQGAVWNRQLIADLRQSQVDLEGRFQYDSQALAFGETALAGLEAPEVPTGAAEWDVVLGAFQAGQIWPYRIASPAFRQVQSAGGLGLVGSPQAQVALSYYYEVSAYDYELVSGGLPVYRQMVRERLDWELQRHIWDSNCQANVNRPGRGKIDWGFALVRCPPPADAERVHRALLALRADVELQRALRGRLSQLKIARASTRRQVERAESVIQLLQ